jgi:hypothetical protein
MTDSEIQSLLDDYKKYSLPRIIVEREFALALVKSGDPMFLLKVPEPFRSEIIRFGLKVTTTWHEISNNGTTDYSEHAQALHALVVRFKGEVPVAQYIQWQSEKREC